MAIYNLGSINADYFYRVPHLPAPGETLLANSHNVGLGGKGANQSVAAALAGREVHHIGAVGSDSDWILQRLKESGVLCDHITISDDATGHAVVYVDDEGENSIVLFPGANRTLNKEKIEKSAGSAGKSDLLLLQNETSLTAFCAEIAAAKGVKVIYSAAPFDPDALNSVQPFLDVLLLNEIEAEQYQAAFGKAVQDSGVPHVVITKGSSGIEYWNDGKVTEVAAIPAKSVDTTGAGDCFAGYFAAGIDEGMGFVTAIQLGAAAASIKVGRPGTSDAFPKRAEVDALLKAHR